MRNRISAIVLALLVLAAAAWAIIQLGERAPSLLVYQHEPVGIMGTRSSLILVTDRRRSELADEILRSAEAELRRLETVLSTWIEASPVSRFNRADGGQKLTIPIELEEVLEQSRALYDQTGGAFDITARPLIELWRLSGRTSPPSDPALAAARAESTWDLLEVGSGNALKVRASVRIDIDGIAKGYAIDRAVELLRHSGARGGMVEVGGDLEVFGEGPASGPWVIALRSPFEDRSWAEIELREGSVCSSGDYARFVEIDGQRFSHIVDPRSGWPTRQSHAVTVVGPTAATADAWATALSVLGPPGLDLLAGSELEAMVVTGEPDSYEVHATAGFQSLLVRAAFDIAGRDATQAP